MKNRYPGPVAFQYEDRTLFFGREEEIKYRYTHLQLQDHHTSRKDRVW